MTENLNLARPTTLGRVTNQTVLNPTLHHKLEAFYSPVLVSNRNVPFSATPVMDQGRKKYSVFTSGEYYRINCPYCGDSRQRLWINHRYGVYDPWTGSKNKYLATCFNETRCFQNPGVRTDFELKVLNNLRRMSIETSILKPVEEPVYSGPTTLPGDCVPVVSLSSDHLAHQYLSYRGFDSFAISEKFNLHYCLAAPVELLGAVGRIIVPIYQDHVLVGWQGRWPADLDWKASKIKKYYIMPFFHKRLYLYNIDAAKRYDTVVVTEGVIDTWAAGDMAVCSFGCDLSSHHRSLLAQYWGTKSIVLAYDSEEYDNMVIIKQELRNFIAAKVGIVSYPAGTDPGTFTVEMNQMMFAQALAAA